MAVLDTGNVRREVDDFLPLSAPTYHILLALGARQMHGYAMMEEVSSRSAGRISLLPGTLYSTLAKMVDAGLVEDAPGEAYEARGGARRYYRATRLGRDVARAETSRLQLLVALAREQGLTEDGDPLESRS